MEIKLPFIEEVPDFTARHRPGIDPKLTLFEREVLDAIDVLEQKKEYAMRISVRAFNIGLINFVLISIVGGPQIFSWVQKHWPFAEQVAVATDGHRK